MLARLDRRLQSCDLLVAWGLEDPGVTLPLAGRLAPNPVSQERRMKVLGLV
jgi:hypothetical protein